MLSGKELGLAIEQAINKKIQSGAIKSKAQVARHFGIKPPSIHDWIKKGSISKDKLPELWGYFSDVVGPEHWGLDAFPLQERRDLTRESVSQNELLNQAYQTATKERRLVIDFLLSIGDLSPKWVDHDVRAYVNTMDSKARKYIEETEEENKTRYKKKTGT
ncbi:hypothetical protein S518_002680 [Salmonella enterica subsp. enterica]|nr:hypothetical protein [Salmonella enterica subsp. enterica]EDW2054876.1 hypothetical protein [Salmonella enterica subsp. enterica]